MKNNKYVYEEGFLFTNTVVQLAKKFPYLLLNLKFHFRVPDNHKWSQSEENKHNQRPHSLVRFTLILSFPLCLVSTERLFPSIFPT
jgi:hypothetical protein